MRAEDLIEERIRLELELADATCVADVMLAHGIAYDELSRVMLVGAFFAEHGGLRREGETEVETAGRLWFDGFVIGLRMGRREAAARPPGTV